MMKSVHTLIGLMCLAVVMPATAKVTVDALGLSVEFVNTMQTMEQIQKFQSVTEIKDYVCSMMGAESCDAYLKKIMECTDKAAGGGLSQGDFIQAAQQCAGDLWITDCLESGLGALNDVKNKVDTVQRAPGDLTQTASRMVINPLTGETVQAQIQKTEESVMAGMEGYKILTGAGSGTALGSHAQSLLQNATAETSNMQMVQACSLDALNKTEWVPSTSSLNPMDLAPSVPTGVQEILTSTQKGAGDILSKAQSMAQSAGSFVEGTGATAALQSGYTMAKDASSLYTDGQNLATNLQSGDLGQSLNAASGAMGLADRAGNQLGVGQVSGTALGQLVGDGVTMGQDASSFYNSAQNAATNLQSGDLGQSLNAASGLMGAVDNAGNRLGVGQASNTALGQLASDGITMGQDASSFYNSAQNAATNLQSGDLGQSLNAASGLMGAVDNAGNRLGVGQASNTALGQLVGDGVNMGQDASSLYSSGQNAVANFQNGDLGQRIDAAANLMGVADKAGTQLGAGADAVSGAVSDATGWAKSGLTSVTGGIDGAMADVKGVGNDISGEVNDAAKETAAFMDNKMQALQSEITRTMKASTEASLEVVRANQNKMQINTNTNGVGNGQKGDALATHNGKKEMTEISEELQASEQIMNLLKQITSDRMIALQKNIGITSLKAQLAEQGSVDNLISGGIISKLSSVTGG